MSVLATSRPLLLVVLLGLHCVLGVDVTNLTDVLPDVVTAPPARLLGVRYNTTEVGLGTVLTVQETAGSPAVDLNWTCTMTTLAMVDPDAPSRENPTRRFWRHWLVVNIPPRSNVSSGDVITSYGGPNPPKGTGYHRYIFLAYSQNGTIDKDALKASVTEERGSFNVTTLTSLPQISKLEAVNYFLTTNSES